MWALKDGGRNTRSRPQAGWVDSMCLKRFRNSARPASSHARSATSNPTCELAGRNRMALRRVSKNTSFTRLARESAAFYNSPQRPKRSQRSGTKKERFTVVINPSNLAAAAGAVVVRSGEGQTLRWGQEGTVRIIARASTTDRSFSIVESTEPPGSGAPLHVHHGEAEAFYILEGTVELTCGGQTVTAHPGDFVYTPKDVPHRFAIPGDKPARMLLLFSRPGFEMFFAEAGSPLDRASAGPRDPAVFRRVVEKYGMELLETPAH